jgi:hypothetical protein
LGGTLGPWGAGATFPSGIDDDSAAHDGANLPKDLL